MNEFEYGKIEEGQFNYEGSVMGTKGMSVSISLSSRFIEMPLADLNALMQKVKKTEILTHKNQIRNQQLL